MAANQFNMRRLLIATAWCALTAFWIAELHGFNLLNAEVRVRGQSPCGNDVILAWWCILLSAGAGVAGLTGYRVLMACVGFLPVAAAILTTIARLHA
jgi:hypothetical protein